MALKSGWKTVRFGDVVHQIKDRVRDLESCSLTEYVRGEHFDPGNLRLIGRSKLGDGLHGQPSSGPVQGVDPTVGVGGPR